MRRSKALTKGPQVSVQASPEQGEKGSLKPQGDRVPTHEAAGIEKGDGTRGLRSPKGLTQPKCRGGAKETLRWTQGGPKGEGHD